MKELELKAYSIFRANLRLYDNFVTLLGYREFRKFS